MLVMAPVHFGNLSCMTPVERAEFSLPTQRLGMATVASLVLRQHSPDRMQLAMFA